MQICDRQRFPVRRTPAKMFTFVRMINQRLRQRTTGIVAEADNLIKNYGRYAFMEARRRTVEANAISTACYWDQVKAEIGRRVLHRSGDEAGCDRLASRPADAVSDGCPLAGWTAEERAQAEAIARLIEVVAGERVDNPVRNARPVDAVVERVPAIGGRRYGWAPLDGIPVVAAGSAGLPAIPRFPSAAPQPAHGEPSSRAGR